MYFCVLAHALPPPPRSQALMQLIAQEVGEDAFGPALLKQFEMVFVTPPDASGFEALSHSVGLSGH
ncbi:hypothetical protein [Pandoraea oxalativorans]|uniref:Uncharacterized protein n=1 Tax=Pandoraea oxalativorans TaxID=573737 RepID=A0A0E3YDH8_9BURK|nr:hypothetical protein [Pandoraea oxalativorans]AKC69930.1 hypothetical protein MB84_11250 [Pandoraea oxalativorans]